MPATFMWCQVKLVGLITLHLTNKPFTQQEASMAQLCINAFVLYVHKILALVQARLEEMQSLDATAKWFEQRAASLSELSYYKDRWYKRLEEETENDISTCILHLLHVVGSSA
jgi:hypothetical protein